MEKQVSSVLKTTFLVHFFVALVFGLIYLLIPDVFGRLINWPIQEPAMYRIIGAAILGYGAGSWLAYRETVWEKVKIVVQMEIIWTILGTIVMVWGMFLADLPAFGWVNTLILAGFAAAFSVLYFRA